MLTVFIRAIVLYALIVLAVRLMGKRQIGELQPSELVVTILVSNIATLPIEDTGIPMLMGVVPILTLVCLDVLMSWLSLKFRPVRRIISGSPKIIIKDGVINQRVLSELRYSVDDIMESLRDYSIFDISEVQFAVVETTGKISVYQKYPYRAATNSDVGARGSSKNPPAVIIDDGRLLDGALEQLRLGRGWLDRILSGEKLSVKEVFLFTADEDGNYNIIKKEG